MKLTENFDLREFNCKCGCGMPQDVLNNVRSVATQLQKVREWVGSPIKINSAYRCINHNRSIGSKDSSQHVLGKAVDIVVSGYSPDEVYSIIDNLNNNPLSTLCVEFNGLGRYNTFTHADIRDTPAKWDNR